MGLVAIFMIIWGNVVSSPGIYSYGYLFLTLGALLILFALRWV
jgi:hypothetical protein